ncbi:right-handed parallel beta-helix repeat-containing protein [bacterium]|nr:right-handed parallel beta-helix repeat-containing protein [bacterium]MBU1958443.1 right-handed parallel beta-helix repeat-containing protein [bacterium]
MKTTNILLSVAAAALVFTGCGSSGGETTDGGTTDPSTCTTYTTPSTTTLIGDITTCTQLTADKTWIIDGLVSIKGTTLKIDAGTTVAGKDGTGDNTSYMVIDKGAKIMAEGTAAQPIIFTSKTAVDGGTAAWGQWGGLTIIGKAGNAQVQPYEVNTAFVADSSDLTDSSGSLKHVKILNSGITMETDKEINGLSLVGVGSGTTIEDITVERSDDDGVEIWGGTVNLTNVTISKCSDDHFDIDDGYAGTVTNLTITQTTGNAAIEMSGTTAATFDTFTITQTTTEDDEGGIYFKNDGIGGHFKNGTVTDNANDGAGAIHSKSTADINNTSFTNVTLAGSSADDKFTGDSATELEAKFDAGTGNTK